MPGKDLAGIGERKAIELISNFLSRGDEAVGIGDDCAAIDLGNEYLLITTDMMNQKTHVPVASAPRIGWHLIAINLSDIASKGGRPIGVVTALGLPRDTSLAFLKGLVTGMDRCARTFNTTIIGGDTKESSVLNLTGTAFGLVGKKAFMPRSGARPGDIIAMTGALGGPAAGLRALQTGKKRPSAIKALLEPWPRVRDGFELGRTGAVTSCIDISDGLSTSLHHICNASKVGALIDWKDLPISPDIHLVGFKGRTEIQGAVLHFGGEYELLFTLDPSPGQLQKVRKALSRTGTKVTVIGVVTSDEVLLEQDGKTLRLENQGWEHFRPHSKKSSKRR